MSVKSSTVRRLSKCCCQCGLLLLRKNFKHSCDQVMFSKVPSKNYHNSDENSLTVSSKQKNENENTECHGIFIHFKGQVYSRQGRPLFLLLGSWSLVLYLLGIDDLISKLQIRANLVPTLKYVPIFITFSNHNKAIMLIMNIILVSV